jgi:Skp family chaperone for outer membrane proteins
MSKHHTVKPPIGKIQMKTLEYIALNPNTLIKPISTTLDIDYKTVNSAVHTLTEKGYIELGEKVKTVKEAFYDSYKIANLGVYFLMAYSNDEKAIRKGIEQFGKEYAKELQTLEDLEKKLAPQTMLKLLRISGKHGIENNGLGLTFSQQLANVISHDKYLTNSEIREFKRAGKNIKQVNEGVRSIYNKLGAYLDGDIENE